MLELLHVWFRQDYEWTEIGPLLAGPLSGSYILGQVTLLSFVPTILLGYTVLSNIRGKKMLYLANFGSLLLLLQVLVMRFNVVIGGQLISKSRRGFVDFDWVVFGKEGVLTAILLLSAPFVAYYVISRFVPIFEEPGRHAKAGDHT
jgi:hypothetical protein